MMQTTLVRSSLPLVAAALLATVPIAAADADGSKKGAKSVHAFTVKTIDDIDYSLKKLQGKVLVIVNVASK